MRVFGLGFVAELLPDKAAQTQKPVFVILILYYAWFFYSFLFK